MSYDFSVRLATGNKDAFVGDLNYTCNVSGMFSLALGVPIASLRGLRMGDLQSTLWRGVEEMRANPSIYGDMNPPNGWGDASGALRVLETLSEWANDYPDGFLHIS